MRIPCTANPYTVHLANGHADIAPAPQALRQALTGAGNAGAPPRQAQTEWPASARDIQHGLLLQRYGAEVLEADSLADLATLCASYENGVLRFGRAVDTDRTSTLRGFDMAMPQARAAPPLAPAQLDAPPSEESAAQQALGLAFQESASDSGIHLKNPDASAIQALFDIFEEDCLRPPHDGITQGHRLAFADILRSEILHALESAQLPSLDAPVLVALRLRHPGVECGRALARMAAHHRPPSPPESQPTSR